MKLPNRFGKILWSNVPSQLDSEEDKRLIIINSINYGNLEHWRWITNHYGKGAVKDVLRSVPIDQLRKRVRPLVSIVFDVKEFNDAPRSPN